MRATLGFLERITLSSDHVGPEDAALPRQAGVSDAALRDAVYVCALFNLIDRVSDALDFAIPSQEGFRKSAKALLKFGYRQPV